MNVIAFCGPLLAPQASSFTTELLESSAKYVDNVQEFFSQWCIEIYLSNNGGGKTIAFIDPWKQTYRHAFEVLRRFWGEINVQEDSQSRLRAVTFLTSRLANLVSLGVNINRIDPYAMGKVEIVRTDSNGLIVRIETASGQVTLGSTMFDVDELLTLEDEMSRLYAFDLAFHPTGGNGGGDDPDVIVYFPNGHAVTVFGCADLVDVPVHEDVLAAAAYAELVASRYVQSARATYGVGTSPRCKVRSVVALISKNDHGVADIHGVAFGAGLQVMNRTSPWKKILGLKFEAENMLFKSVRALFGVFVIEFTARMEWTASMQSSRHELGRTLSASLTNALEKFKLDTKRTVNTNILRSLCESLVPIFRDSQALTKDAFLEVVAPIGNEPPPEGLHRHLRQMLEAPPLDDEANNVDDDVHTLLIDENDDVY